VDVPEMHPMRGSCTSVCPVKINIHQQIYRGIAHRGDAIDAAQATAPT
jgi:L-lactate utilization protein LutB